MQLYPWQERFLQFLDTSPVRYVNLHGAPYGKTTLVGYMNDHPRYQSWKTVHVEPDSDGEMTDLDDILTDEDTVIVSIDPVIDDRWKDRIVYYELPWLT